MSPGAGLTSRRPTLVPVVLCIMAPLVWNRRRLSFSVYQWEPLIYFVV